MGIGFDWKKLKFYEMSAKGISVCIFFKITCKFSYYYWILIRAEYLVVFLIFSKSKASHIF